MPGKVEGDRRLARERERASRDSRSGSDRQGGGSTRSRGNRSRARNRGRNQSRGQGQAKKLAGLLDPSSATTGKDLLKLARALTRTELRPEIRAYKRLTRELQGQASADQMGLERLGNDVRQNIGAAYRGLDAGAQGAGGRVAAIGSMLNNEQQQIGAQAAQQANMAQTGALGGLSEAMALRGAPGGGQAQQQLQALVDAQAGRLAADNAASATSAAAMGSNYGGLLEGMRTSATMRGAEDISSAERQIAARRAEARLAAGQDIREARGKMADVRALKGETLLQNISELRERERDYELGRAATRTDRRGQDLDAAADAARLAETARSNRADEAVARQNANTSAQRAAQDRLDDIRDNQQDRRDGRNGGGNGGDRLNDAEARQEQRRLTRDARSAARSVARGRTTEYLESNFDAFVQEIKSRLPSTAGAQALAEQVARRYIQRH